eukprot:6487668-Alexandrium_andersonii.AAC.1
MAEPVDDVPPGNSHAEGAQLLPEGGSVEDGGPTEGLDQLVDGVHLPPVEGGGHLEACHVHGEAPHGVAETIHQAH